MFAQTINVHVIIITVRVLPIKYLFSPAARAVYFRIDQYYNRFIIRRSTILPLIVGRLTRSSTPFANYAYTLRITALNPLPYDLPFNSNHQSYQNDQNDQLMIEEMIFVKYINKSSYTL